MDGTVPPGAPRQRTMDRILEVAKLYLYVADKSRDAAALLLAKWVERQQGWWRITVQKLAYCL